MPEFKDLAALEKYVAQAMSDTLQKEVANLVREEWADMIDETVYSPFTPREYKRRGTDGGLNDSRNIQTLYGSTGNDSFIKLINTTEGNTDLQGKRLSRFMESIGNPNRGPIKYTQKTTNLLINTSAGSRAFKSALESGLRRNGIRAKIK